METLQISLDELLHIFTGDPEALERVMARNYGTDGLVGVHAYTAEAERLMIIDPRPTSLGFIRAIDEEERGDLRIRAINFRRVGVFTPSNAMHAVCQKQQLKAARKAVGESLIEEARKGEPQF